MKQLLFQVILIVGVLAVAWRLLVSYGQKAQAVRRIGLILFAAFAVWSISNPSVLNQIAGFFGIGRGADLVFYGLVIAFLGFVVTTFKRFRGMEVRYTRLARRIALDEATPAAEHAAAALARAAVLREATAPQVGTPDAGGAPSAVRDDAPTANPATLAATPPTPSTRAADAD